MSNLKSFPADTSLEYKTFLNNKKINGELYAYLLSQSCGDEKGRTIVYRNKLPSQTEIGKILKVSRRTIINYLNNMKESGYIVEDNINNLYILPKKEKMYFQMPQKTLNYLQKTVREPVVKTYIYLGQRDRYKKQMGETYVFTLAEICEHLGLNSKSKNKEDYTTQTINYYLIALYKFGLIDYAEFFDG